MERTYLNPHAPQESWRDSLLQQGPRGFPLSVIHQTGGWFLARKEEENLFQGGWVCFKPGQFPCSGAPSLAPSIVSVDSGPGLPVPWAMTVSGERSSGPQAREWWGYLPVPLSMTRHSRPPSHKFSQCTKVLCSRHTRLSRPLGHHNSFWPDYLCFYSSS